MDDNPPENDGVLHQGEEDQQHAGKQPDLGQPSQVIETSTGASHLHSCYCIRDWDPRAEYKISH